jgi:glycyl-tRNA synthetase
VRTARIPFPSSDIYGGLNGFWDYGPLGVELKRKIKDAWQGAHISRRADEGTLRPSRD